MYSEEKEQAMICKTQEDDEMSDLDNEYDTEEDFHFQEDENEEEEEL